jgi:sugar/nucleoside kinase (ribokinase family)
MKVTVAGHICLDIIPQITGADQEHYYARLLPGHLLEVGAAAIATGGPVSNTGLALHKLGISTQLSGKVGTDLFGQAICNVLAARSPELSKGMLIDPASDTSYSIVISPHGMDRIFLHNPGANDTFCALDVDYNQVSQSDLFHFGYPPLMRRMYENDGAELAEIFRRVKALGVLTSLDMAFPDPASPAGKANWRAIFQAALPYVDIFLPSIEELLFCLRRPLYDELASKGNSMLDNVTPDLLNTLSAELLEMGAKIVVLKLGERGLYLRTAAQDVLQNLEHGIDAALWGWNELWSPCFQVDVVGTTGSGDATIAGFLSGIMRGLNPTETMTMAVAVGACNVEAADALGGICTWEETRARIQQGWPRHAL